MFEKSYNGKSHYWFIDTFKWISTLLIIVISKPISQILRVCERCVRCLAPLPYLGKRLSSFNSGCFLYRSSWPWVLEQSHPTCLWTTFLMLGIGAGFWQMTQVGTIRVPLCELGTKSPSVPNGKPRGCELRCWQWMSPSQHCKVRMGPTPKEQ